MAGTAASEAAQAGGEEGGAETGITRDGEGTKAATQKEEETGVGTKKTRSQCGQGEQRNVVCC